MGPTSKEKKNNKRQKLKEAGITDSLLNFFFFSFFFLLLVLSQILEFLTVRIRRDKHEKWSTRRGLCVSTKNMGFFTENSGKYSKKS